MAHRSDHSYHYQLRQNALRGHRSGLEVILPRSSGALSIFSQLTRACARHFPASAALERSLKNTVRGEVRFDAGSRVVCDRLVELPPGADRPRHPARRIRWAATIAACREAGAPILPRGAGTSLAGQCCNVAVIMDFSKYLNRIITLDPANQIARVEPGIVLDRVRDAAEVHHLTFAPDPATHSRCTLGGMIGNNSCGVHALMGGKTVDNIHALDVMLYDGTRMNVGSTSEAELDAIIRAGGRQGQIYAGLKTIRDRFAPLIREKFPRIPRRVSGYNLDELLPENGFNVARAARRQRRHVRHSSQRRRSALPPVRRSGVVCVFPIPSSPPITCRRFLLTNRLGSRGSTMRFPIRCAQGMRLDEVKVLPEGKGVLLVEFGAWTSERRRAGRTVRRVAGDT